MKKLLAILLAAMLALTLCACGLGDTPETPVDDPVTPVDEPQSDPGDGGVDEKYVDMWYLFGDLSFNSLRVFGDGTWELRNPEDANGKVICEGAAVMDDEGDLLLYEKDGGEVGFAQLNNDEMTLYLYSDFEFLLEEYLSGALTFNRESASVRLEDQPVVDPNGSDPGDGGISMDYVDIWFLFGDKAFDSLIIFDNSTWELRGSIDDGFGNYIVCEGYSAQDAGTGGLYLHEMQGAEVGFATLEDGQLKLSLTKDYEYLLENYLSGDLMFARESESVEYEPQTAEELLSYDGYWMYDNGYVLEIFNDEWCLYDDGGMTIQYGPMGYDEEAAYLMNEDGSSGGGKVQYNEMGDLFDGDQMLIPLDEFPYGNSEE